MDKISFIKFTFLNNLNLLEYFNFGRNNGLDFSQSIIVIFINILILNFIGFYVFENVKCIVEKVSYVDIR